MSTKSLESKTVKELRELAKAAGVKGYTKLAKDALVAALAAAEKPEKKTAAPKKKAPAKARKKATAENAPAKPEAVAPDVPECSEEPAPHPEPLQQQSQHEAFDVVGELPTTYLKPRAVLLLKNPEWFFLYWDFDPETAARMTVGNRPALLRILQDGREVQRVEVDLGSRRYYVRVPEGGGRIRAELGKEGLGEFLPVLRSEEVEAPRARVSDDRSTRFSAPAWTGANPSTLRHAHFLTEEQYRSFFGHVKPDLPWYRSKV